MKFKRLISIALVFAFCSAGVNGFAKSFYAGEYSEEYHDGGYDAGYDPNYDCNMIDDQEVKVLIDDNFTYTSKSDVWFDDNHVPSGWDVRTIGGELNGAYYFSKWELKDESDVFPIEATRRFEMLNHGYGILEFSFTMPEIMNDVRWQIYKDRISAFGVETKNGSLYMRKSGGQMELLTALSAGTTYGVKMEFNIDENAVKSISVNGVTYARNIPFENAVDYINNFNINTGDETKGKLQMHTVQLSRGYKIYERFHTALSMKVPDDYVTAISDDGSAKISKSDSATYPDSYHLTLDGKSGTAAVSKGFDTLSGKRVFEIAFIQLEKSDNASVILKNGDADVFEIKTENGNLAFNGERFYENYLKRVWYKLKVVLDMNNQTADVYLNYRPMLTNVKINGASINNLVMKSGSGATGFDRIKLYEFTPEPEDYCPEPVPALNPDYNIGMQFCPMWKNGSHIGWDSINTDKDRLHYLGYYDEGNPEVNDWIIKQLVEHGMSFQKVMWCNGANASEPPQTAFVGGEFLDGFLQAKYNDMMKFYVCWENQAMGSNAKHLLENVGPYWIEHYLKHDSYLKIDGRPVVGFYTDGDYIRDTVGETDAEKRINAMEGLKQFRQMCIDAGVGNPILALCSTTTSAETAKSYKEFGWDLLQPYGTSIGTYFDQGRSEERMLAAAEEGGIWQFPTYSNGVDGTVWKSMVTGYIPNATFREAMEDQKAIADSRDKSDPFYNFAVVETYDEHGEGHYIAPVGRTGFSQFDVIREVFVDDEEHEDIVPTMKQKNRFNNLYPYGRNVPTTPSGQTVESFEGLEVKQGWYFEEDGNLEGWKNGGDVESLQVVDGCLEGIQSGNDPKIMTSFLVEAEEVSFIKVRMKVKTDARAQFFFATSESGGYSEAKSNFASLFTNDFEEIIINMSSNPQWTSLITSLRIDPMSSKLVEGKENKFYIDSIEFLGVPTVGKEEVAEKDKPGFKICIDGEYTKPDAEHIIKNEKVYFPLRKTAEIMGASRIDYDEKNHIVNILKDDRWVQIDLEKEKVRYNGEESYGESMIAIENGTTYVDSRVLALVFNVDNEWNDVDTLMITTAEAAGTSLPRKKLYAAEFKYDGDLEGWTSYLVKGLGVSQDVLKGSADNESPILWTPSLGIAASEIKNISIAYQNSSMATNAAIYFKTTGSPSWGEDKRINIKVTPNDSGITVYNIDPSKYSGWSGTITALRFDPCSNQTTGNFEIDYFRIEGEEDENMASANQAHKSITDKGVAWEFSSNGTPDGWELSKSFGNVKINKGYLCATVVGDTPYLKTMEKLNLKTTDYSKIKIKFKNNTKSTKARVYFSTDKNTCYCKDNCFEINTYPEDSVGAVYEIDTSANANWSGILKGLKIEPVYNEGDVAIDYIRLEY